MENATKETRIVGQSCPIEPHPGWGIRPLDDAL